MTAVRIAFARLRGVFSSASRLDEEIAAHLEMLAADYEQRGLAPAEARLRARREFGAIAQMRELHREQRRLPFLDSLAQDLRYALRQLRRNPAFSAAAILTLALGIGANAAIYRVLDSVVFRSLAVPDSGRLAIVRLVEDGKPQHFSYPLYREMAARQQVATGLIAASNTPLHNAILRGRGSLQTVNASLVSGNYFEVLGVSATRGRVFTTADDRASAPVAVISDAFQKREFSAVPALGATLEINRALVTVIGVMPSAFFGESAGSAPEVWLPMSMQPLVSPADWLDAPYSAWLEVTARLRPGVTPAQAAQSLTALDRQLPDLAPRRTDAADHHVELEPAASVLAELNARTAHPLFILMGISAVVLLIACCNLANLLLGRAMARTHEIGVRLALGAGRARLVRHLLTESVLLAALGTLAAAALAAWGSRALVRVEGWQLTLDPSWRVPGFTAAIAICATLLFGLAPALAATRCDLLPALRADRRTVSGGRTRSWPGKLLVAAQIALSLLLLSGAALFGRTMWNLQHQDFGFARGNVLMVELPVEFGPHMIARANALRPVLYERLHALPGVRSAALSACGLMSTWQRTGPVASADRPALKSDFTRHTYVTPGYFETLGIPIVAGRSLNSGDRADAPAVVVLSQTAARTIFGAADPLGRLISTSYQFDSRHALRVAGIAHDVRFNPRDPYAFQIYLPFAQSAVPVTEALVRTAGDPAALTATVRAAIRDLDPTVAVGEVATLDGKIASAVTHERMMAILAACFGLLALALTGAGVYGVVSYAVERRTSEIGIRLALGSTRPQVASLMLRDLAPFVAASLLLGLVATLAAARAVRGLLYGVATTDVASLAIAAVALTAVAALAAWLPARRASRLDPVDALRQL